MVGDKFLRVPVVILKEEAMKNIICPGCKTTLNVESGSKTCKCGYKVKTLEATTVEETFDGIYPKDEMPKIAFGVMPKKK